MTPLRHGRGRDAPAAPLRSGRAALHVGVLLFGLAGLFGKWVTVGPVLIVFGRVIFGAGAWGALLGWLGRDFRPREQRPLLLAAAAILFFHWVAFFQSVQVSTVAIALLSFSTAPMFTALLEPWWFRERFSFRYLLAALVTLVGIAVMVLPLDADEAVRRGVAWGVAAGLSFALLSLANRGLRRHYDSTALVFFQTTLVGVLVLPVLPFVWGPFPLKDIALLAALGLIGTTAHSLFVQALTTVRVREATLVGNLEPVYGTVLAALLLAEIPSPRTLAGGLLILLAAGWVTLRGGPQPT